VYHYDAILMSLIVTLFLYPDQTHEAWLSYCMLLHDEYFAHPNHRSYVRAIARSKAQRVQENPIRGKCMQFDNLRFPLRQ